MWGTETGGAETLDEGSVVRERERKREQEGWCEKSLSPVLSATFVLFSH